MAEGRESSTQRAAAFVGQLPALLLSSLILFFVCFAAFHFRFVHVERSNTNHDNVAQLIDAQSPKVTKVEALSCTLHNIGGTEATIALPQNEVVGLLVVAHGCSHGSKDWCSSNPSCVDCLGLPAELEISRTAIARNFAVLSISSSNRQSGCWGINDLESFAQTVAHTRTDLKLSNTHPTILFGVSSGGGIVSFVAATNAYQLAIKGIIVQVSSIPPMVLEEFPPNIQIIFQPMTKDTPTLQRVQSAASQLQSQSTIIPLHPIPLSQTFFSSHIPHLPPSLSKSIFDALVSTGEIDSSTNILVRDPRTSSWREAVRKILQNAQFEDSLVADKSPISEVLNTAFGLHEISAVRFAEALDLALS